MFSERYLIGLPPVTFSSSLEDSELISKSIASSAEEDSANLKKDP